MFSVGVLPKGSLHNEAHEYVSRSVDRQALFFQENRSARIADEAGKQRVAFFNSVSPLCAACRQAIASEDPRAVVQDSREIRRGSAHSPGRQASDRKSFESATEWLETRGLFATALNRGALKANHKVARNLAQYRGSKLLSLHHFCCDEPKPAPCQT